VKVARAWLTSFRLPLRVPLTTAHGRIGSREGVLLQLESDAGATGLGTACPLPGFGTEDLERCRAELERLALRVLSCGAATRGAVLDEAVDLAPAAPAARAALDGALHDLEARARGVRVADLLAEQLGTEARARVPVSALVVGRRPGEVAACGRALAARGFSCLKLKVGVGSLAQDEERLAALRDAVGSAPRVRLDANGAWKEREAAAALERFAGYGVEFVEQPVAACEVESLARVRARSPVPIAADESACGEAQVLRVLELGAADLIVLKPSAIGGLRVALRIAGWARAAGVGVLVTSLLDASPGVASALHLAAALPGPLPACGLATSGLLADDLAAIPEPLRGELALPRRAGPGRGRSCTSGLGLRLDVEALARTRSGPSLELRP